MSAMSFQKAQDLLKLAGMSASDLNRDGKDDLLLVGTSQFAVMLNGVQQGTFEEVASYENTDPEEVLFGDLIVGDINGDGYPDILAFGNSATFTAINHGEYVM